MILSLVEKHIALRKQGAHYVGKCPVCGGSDETTRFVVNIARGFCQCYSCGFNADPVRFLRQIEGKTCPEAHRTLDITCDRPECPVFDKCSRGRGDRPVQTPTTSAPARPVGPVIHQADTPAAVWQQKAAALVEHAHATLLNSPDQLAYLAGRGLPQKAVEKYKLGYIEKDLYKDRAAWGLPEEIKENGKPKKLWIPQGILIPWMEQDGSGSIHRIRIRKQTLHQPKDPRYHWLPGSGNDIICLNPTAKAHVIVESDLDGLLIDWSAGDLVATVPLGSCSTRPKTTAFESLKNSLQILVALDFDKPKFNEQKNRMIVPGAEACGWWSKTFPATWKRWPVSDGKDPGEAFQAGVDIRAWILCGLPPVCQIPAPKPAVVSKPVEPAATAIPPEPQMIKDMTDRKGRSYTITDSPEIYRQKRQQGEVVFSIKEIELSIQAVNTAGDQGEKLADLIMETKQIFKGSFLKEVNNL